MAGSEKLEKKYLLNRLALSTSEETVCSPSLILTGRDLHLVFERTMPQKRLGLFATLLKLLAMYELYFSLVRARRRLR